jgi:putative ABC transport system substrate-binding protein
LRRREFITLLFGAAVTQPCVASGQQADRVRRIGVLVGGTISEPKDPNLAMFRKALQDQGWIEGTNVRFDYRFGAADRGLLRTYAVELVGLQPDILFAGGSGAVAPLLEATRTIPVVFMGVVDPVALGFVASLAKPGGNATGFTNFDYSVAGKWVELLRQVAPGIKRVAVLRDPTQFAGAGQLGAIQTAATSVGVELRPADVRDDKEIERAISAVSPGSNGGLIVQSSFASGLHSKVIVTLAAKYRVPAVYPRRQDVTGGGLISYGPDSTEDFRRAGEYVDRILKGEKPALLPVQNPTKYNLVINLKAAKTIGLTVPPGMLATADEVIE